MFFHIKLHLANGCTIQCSTDGLNPYTSLIGEQWDRLTADNKSIEYTSEVVAITPQLLLNA